MSDANQGLVLSFIVFTLIASTGFAAHLISANSHVQQKLTQSSFTSLPSVPIKWPESCYNFGLIMCFQPDVVIEGTLSTQEKVCLELGGAWTAETACCRVNEIRVF